MIYDKLSNILLYKGIHPNVDLALDYIHAHLEDMPEKVELLGQDVRAFRTAYETIPEEKAYFEAHAEFADIQIVCTGRERIAVTDVSELEVYEVREGKDFWALRGPEKSSLLMDSSVFVLVMPGEGHKLKVQVDGPENVTKAVFKIRVK